MIKGTAPKEDVTLVNIYALNIGAPKYIKQILMDTKATILLLILCLEDLSIDVKGLLKYPTMY